jgi:ABC-2 type transport system permease protein
MRTLRACISIFRIKAAEGMQYRMAGLAGASTSIFWALIEIVVYTIFYKYADAHDSAVAAGFSLKQLISYIWLRQMLMALQPFSIDGDLLNMINRGDIGVEMCRPLDLYSNWFARTAASRLSPLLCRGMPVIIFGAVMPEAFRLSPPASLISFICFVFSTLSALLLCTSFGMLANSLRLSINWGDAPSYMIMTIGGVLSGNFLPLQLWPEFMRDFLLLQPFAGFLDIPLRFYLGTLAPGNIFWTLGLQTAWSLVFIAAGQVLTAGKLKNVIVQGG